MKKFIYSFMLLAFSSVASAGPIYLTAAAEPWGHTTNIENFDAAFGAGNWDRATFGDAGLFDDTANFLYVDGGDGNTTEFEAWVNTNRGNIEAFVAGVDAFAARE